MASKGIRFKVWEGRASIIETLTKGGHRVLTEGKKQYYFHDILGNNKVVQPSEGYDDVREAFEAIDAVWYDTAVAQGHPSLLLPAGMKLKRADAIKRWVGLRPVPYTKDSLKPIPR